MKGRLAALVAAGLIMVVGLPVGAAPLNLPPRHTDGLGRPAPPELDAASWILYDAGAGVVLAEHDADMIRAPASITKIMTALVALESADLDEPVIVSNKAAATGEREIGLVAGETVPLRALLKAAMIHSANDAATAIAEHIGGSVEGFAALMNEKARRLGMSGTTFVNPHGLDAPGHVTTARDMLTLAVAAMEHPVFREIARARLMTFPPAPDGARRIGVSTNLLLEEYEGATGIKTGFTSTALLTIVASAERSGRQVYTVVLGTEARRSHFEAARRLFDYAFGDLAIYGAAAGAPYRSARLAIQPDPLLATVAVETQLHLAGGGLLAANPRPPEDLPDLPPPPTVTTQRRPDGALTPAGALVHWLDRLFGP